MDEIALGDLDRRIIALETVVASLLPGGKTQPAGDQPCGRFAHLGGVERRGPTTFEKRETPMDFPHIGGRRVG